ncbi:protein neuralized-like isoform X2 [Haemaphysalis longicornis]
MGNAASAKQPEAEAGDAGKSVVFHEVHGENVQLDKEKKVARRVKSYCKSVVFSSRPIEPGEVVLLHLTECCEDWSGSIRVGFTTHNPVSLKASLPTSAYPNLMNVPGNWVKPVDDDHAKQDAYIHFYVTEAGEVLYGSNGKDETELLTGIDTSGPLWALIDVYGRTLAIEIFDEGAINSSSDEVKEMVQAYTNARKASASSKAGDDKWTHLAYHKILGPNTRLDPGDSQVAERCELGKRKAFAFLSRPLATNELLQVKVEGWEEALPGSLSFGMTTCDPSSLSGKTGELPDNLDNLLDREEYWVFQKALNCALNDQLVFVTRDDGTKMDQDKSSDAASGEKAAKKAKTGI